MNGWLRLWVLVSVVWSVLVVSVAAIVIPEVAAPEVGSAMSSKEAAALMEEVMIEAELADGTVLEFPPGTDDAVIDRVVKQHIAGKAPAPNKQDTDALRAQEYLSDAEFFSGFGLNPPKAEKPALANRGRFYVQSLAWLAIPPLIFLLLGYGFAWVLRGFGSSR